MNKILITYATKTGTTKDAALEIGRVLVENGLKVDVLPITDINTLDGYSAVIIGAPINGMRWVPEAVQFVEAHQKELTNVITAYFLVSYLLIEGREFWKKKIRTSLDKINEKVKPVKIGMFGGKVSSTFPVPFRLLFGVKKDAPIDVQDLNTVRTWANELAALLNNK